MLSAKRNIPFFKILLIIGFVYFFWLMLSITLEYIPLDPNVSFLMIKQTEVEQRPEYLYFFYTHVYTSIFVLLSGFLAILRKDFGWKSSHRNTGKVYIFLILILAAPSGIYMGFFANGGLFFKNFICYTGLFMVVFYLQSLSASKTKKI
ncbi:DUF2306 domain-containing protein [Chryseobacterium capnotolerans]|uniref:DUF2306 domain-containing protein n=1 Tax=Chryseobacterium capnotolerans TaxID=2759528 RepID=UPI0024B532C2|nr:DUF2306 domain-containing protein [Chryseobacterium capnotolerans]